MPPVRELYVTVLGALTACAQAGEPGQSGDPDASVQRLDSSGGGGDSNLSGTDSSTGCTTMTVNLLANGNLDAAGTNWTVTPIISGDPIINTKAADNGPVEAQTPAYRAWMGGVEQAPATNKDTVHQDVMIPASTTALEFAGYYDVRSDETTTTNEYDKADVQLVSSNGTMEIALIKHLSNKDKTTGWTPFSKSITTNLTGQTIRFRISTSGDGLYATSFFFDSLALNATVCE
jgi:hypothetical protein